MKTIFNSKDRADSEESAEKSTKKGSAGGIRPLRFVQLVLLLGTLGMLALAAVKGGVGSSPPDHFAAPSTIVQAEESSVVEITPEEVDPYGSDEITEFHPTCTPDTRPENLIKETAIMVDDEELEDITTYSAKYPISFDSGSRYTDMDGVITFRGNNFRSDPVYGTADMKSFTLQTIWYQATGHTSYNGKNWTGSGWTGQPLITSWPKELRQHMNMYDWAKTQEELTEVIYATLDGNIYFLELTTGNPTRDPMRLGFTFKGSGALDPRGYPLMYVGSGYNSTKGRSRAFIINLLDCTVLYEWGNKETFANRSVPFFDSSPLVHAETDTLVYPGENGILYLIHLNTDYDEKNGTISVEPDHIVKWKYRGQRTTSQKYWLGMEDSGVAYENYYFIADNGGNLMCLDLNTLQLVWVQDTLDDTNGSPVLSVENGHPYIYIGTSFHKGWRDHTTADVPLFKIDAENGEVVWKAQWSCKTVEDVSGGIQSTPALGKNGLREYVYVTVARTDSLDRGVLACLNKETGEVVWQHEATYVWSSPVCVYDSEGNGYVIYADIGGQMYLVNGLTGERMYQIELSSGSIESSPAVYNNMLVIGIRAGKIWGIRLN